MRRRQQFLGQLSPVRGWLHRTPTGVKFVALAAFGAVLLSTRNLGVNLALIVGLILVGFSAKIPLRLQFASIRKMLIPALFLALLQLIFGTLLGAVTVITTLAACVLAAGLLTLTTTVPALLEFFVYLATPLRRFGVEPEVVGLAIALTIRSVPYLADLSAIASDAARSRGLDYSLKARTVPVILGAVEHARATGRALQARGLAE